MKKVYAVLLFFVLLLSGCNETTKSSNDFVDSGFLVNTENSEPTPWLATAIKTKRIQESVVNLTVYAGYASGFIDKWNDDVWNSNPGYGKFVLQRVIRDREEIDISNYIYPLIDFGDKNKYSVRIVGTTDGTDKVEFRDFSFNFDDEIDLNEITIEQGAFFYDICLVDDNTQVVVENLNCGISLGFLYFIKTDNQITFSIYDSIFNE